MPTAPYDTVEAVLQTARVRLNDAIVAISGDVLTDTAAFSQTLVNAAWRRFQDLLANYGVAALNREAKLQNVPAWAAVDQGEFVWFDWTGYWDGAVQQPAPVFPQDMITPLDLFERPHGTTGYTPMDQVMNGLPTVPRDSLNRLWEWRNEQIWMPGATAATDIRMRYAGYLADFAEVTGPPVVHWYQQPVPIMRALNPLAWFICAEAARARGDLDAGSFESQAIQATEQIFSRDVRQGKSLYKRSELGKMTDATTPTMGPAGPRGKQ